LFIVIGFVVVFGSIVVGYTMHGGDLMVLMQISEFVIIGGAGLGAVMIANRPREMVRITKDTLGLLKPSPYKRESYGELLQVLYDLFYAAKRDGLVGIESHIENPEESELFARYPTVQQQHHAVSFLSDTMKVLLTGAVADHHLSEILELDMERQHESALMSSHAMARLGDAMPAFGIVAAVLGVIITMGYIGGSPEVVGKAIAAALVGTFLGVLLAYGVFAPLAQALEARARGEEAYLGVIRTALVSFSRGDPPITSVEFARRNIDPEDRPSFSELEDMTRRRA
jgi:chemotaxis protein MotA